MVVAEQSSQTFAAFDVAGRVADFVTGIDQPVFQTLMIAFLVIVRREFGKCLPQGCFAEEDHAVQAFRFQAQHKALDVGIAIGTSRWQQNRIDLSVGLEEITQRHKLRVAVNQDERMIFQEAVVRIREIACNLTDPRGVWLSGDTCDFHSACLQVHHHQNERLTSPRSVETSVVVKSMAATESQCAFKKVSHVVCRFR